MNLLNVVHKEIHNKNNYTNSLVKTSQKSVNQLGCIPFRWRVFLTKSSATLKVSSSYSLKTQLPDAGILLSEIPPWEKERKQHPTRRIKYFSFLRTEQKCWFLRGLMQVLVSLIHILTLGILAHLLKMVSWNRSDPVLVVSVIEHPNHLRMWRLMLVGKGYFSPSEFLRDSKFMDSTIATSRNDGWWLGYNLILFVFVVDCFYRYMSFDLLIFLE